MTRAAVPLSILLAGSLLCAADEDVAVFHSDVSLVRVDVQVLDRDNRAITALRAGDFVIRDEGRVRETRNFAREEMPLDVLMLLDVSVSMRPHVERIGYAARQALEVLGKDDRVGIMVFDRATRLRLPMRGNREDVVREFDSLLRQETFRGGTDITRALLDAAKYVGRNARREARRAIVILTDDQTEMNRDEARVEKGLIDADAVLSALIAPNAMRGPRYPGGGHGGSWPGSTGPGRRGPLGGVIIGPGGRGGPGAASRTRSAGTSEIARASGGDSLPVDGASALETTLARLRQRYALYFLVPPGSRPGQERSIEVALATGAGSRYPGADLHFRRTYLAPGKPGDPVSSEAETTVVAEAASKTSSESADRNAATETPRLKRRPAVDESVHARGPNPAVGDASSTSAIPAAASEPAPTKRGGWRRVDEPEPGAVAGSAPK